MIHRIPMCENYLIYKLFICPISIIIILFTLSKTQKGQLLYVGQYIVMRIVLEVVQVLSV